MKTFVAMLKVSLKNNRVHFGNRFSVSLQRTLRIPDDDQIYPLPPGLGLFPIHEVAAYADRVPASWNEHDFFVPMYQREALWIGFDGDDWRPNAVKVGTGKINAISGTPWDGALHDSQQDYLVCPPQLWIDGINSGENFIRQFVAMPLGQGYSIEGQLTGKEDVGGIQLLVFEPKPGMFPDQPPPRQTPDLGIPDLVSRDLTGSEMGLAAGGRMKQKIYPDTYGKDTWDPNQCGSAQVHLINSLQYESLTGLEAPPTPITAETYNEFGLPWFELYDEALGDITAPEQLTRIESIGQLDEGRDSENESDLQLDIDNYQIKKLG